MFKLGLLLKSGLELLKGGGKPLPMSAIVSEIKDIKETKRYARLAGYILSGLVAWLLIARGIAPDTVTEILMTLAKIVKEIL